MDVFRVFVLSFVYIKKTDGLPCHPLTDNMPSLEPVPSARPGRHPGRVQATLLASADLTKRWARRLLFTKGCV